MSSDLIESLEAENRMLRARIARTDREAADRQGMAQPHGCDYCSSSLFAGRKCKSCGKDHSNESGDMAQGDPMAWPIRGVRVEGDTVIIKVKGGNDAARWLCGEILAVQERATGGQL